MRAFLVVLIFGVAWLGFSTPCRSATTVDLQLAPALPATLQNPGGVLHVQAWIRGGLALRTLTVTITSRAGQLIFSSGLPARDYVTLDWRVPEGLADGFYVVRINAGGAIGQAPVTSQEFLLQGRTTAICAYKFMDVNRDGIYDPNIDHLAAGWEICVDHDLGCQVTQEGEWVVCWFFPPVGTYEVCETLQPGYVPTRPACQTIEIQNGVFEKIEFGNAVAQGACCMADGSCRFETADECRQDEGAYQGDGVACDPSLCPLPPPPTGACCLPDGSCAIMTTLDCDALGGIYMGDGTICGNQTCGATAIERTTWGELKRVLSR